MGSDSHDALNKQLSSLLGFEDGASDVLDYLLSIEDNEALLEYLGQLLGSTTDEKVRHFVDNVGKVQRGEPISIVVEEEKPSAAATPSASSEPKHQTKQREPIGSQTTNQKSNRTVSTATTKSSWGTNKCGAVSRETKPPPAQTAKKQANNFGSSPPPIIPQTNGSNPVGNKNEITSAQSQTPKSSPANEKDATAAAIPVIEPPSATTTKSSEPSYPKKTKTKSKKKPITGKAPFECGCFGIKHKPLANCLYCGRVSCEKEGYNFCPFCGHLVEAVKAPDETDYDEKDIGPELQAWKLKESMLQKDRSQSRRAQVIDDQSDYFPSAGEATSAWLNEDEKAAAMLLEQERQMELHRRQNMQLKLAPS